MKNKILIIDDDQDFLDAIKLFLESKGFTVFSAANGQEGFRAVKEEAPDLILLDMVMTYKTEGAETARALAADAAVREIPVILVTGARRGFSLPFELKPDKKSLPVKAVIEKPVDPEALLKTVKTYIARIGGKHRREIEGIDHIAEKWAGKKGNLIMILHEIQNMYGYVPREVSFELCRILNIPLAQIYEVITFYNYFKLEKPGKHTISVCMGTACYLKGAPVILKELNNILNIKEGHTTKDRLFHLQVVRCLGCCGLAPVIMIDNKIYGKLKKEDLVDIISGYSAPEVSAGKGVSG